MTHGASGKNKRRIARLEGGLVTPFFLFVLCLNEAMGRLEPRTVLM